MTALQTIANAVGAAAGSRGHSVACAESVTAGLVAQHLAAAPDASEWFAGGIVAYGTPAKRELLDVTAERIVSPACARQLATGARDLFHADIAVGITGVGGPDSEDGEPPGTVYIAVAVRDRLHEFAHRFDGPPAEVVERATEHALRHLQGGALDLRRGS